jgi:hypothetical protein
MNPQEAVAMVVLIILVLIAGAVLVWLIYWDYQKKKLQHEERRSMIEKGMTPQPMLASTPSGTAAQTSMQLQQLRFEERRLMIEKGMVPPPLLLDENLKSPNDYLRRGLIMFFLGGGAGIGYFALERGNEMKELIGFVSPIVGLLGLGYIIYGKFAPGPKKEQPVSGKTTP